jgi:uncharacterized protein
MWSVLSGVLLASVLGSLHCAGMCGGIVVVVAGDSGAANFAYNFGRLVSYTLVGAIAGYFGVMLDLGGDAAGISHMAIVTAGVVMLGYGTLQLLRVAGMQITLPSVPGMSKMYGASFAKVQHRGPITRAFLVGILTALLPCGWLYLFAINAATTQDPLAGALIMISFWMGTVPVLMTMGVIVKLLGDKVKRRLPMLSALILIAVGTYALLGRWHMPSFAARLHGGSTTPACCDEV